ncbi:MAG: hypothetical protein KJZ83_03495 [Burkholderiaceae bacterium]|nr:hypothetical protein [Burkholderiaceae bacterium]
MNPLEALSTSAWGYPVVEVFHLLGVAMLLGNLVLFELRLLGLGAAIEIQPLARLALPIALGGFALAALSGALMFATQPWELLPNPAFRIKIALVLVAGVNAVWFHRRGSLARRDRVARAQVLVSLAVWVAVLASGRAIAYV